MCVVVVEYLFIGTMFTLVVPTCVITTVSYSDVYLKHGLRVLYLAWGKLINDNINDHDNLNNVYIIKMPNLGMSFSFNFTGNTSNF